MKAVFFSLLDKCIASSLLIAAIVIVRLFKDVPKNTRRILWSFAVLRLISPFSVKSVFSLIPQKQYTVELQETVPVVNMTLPFPTENASLPPPVFSEAPSAPDIWAIASAVWLAGAILMLLYMSVSLIRVRTLVKEAIKRDNYFLCDRISGAFVLGFFRPRIYIPFDLENKNEYVIAHELAHIKGLDHIWKPIGFILLSVYWFDPLCWLAYILFCRDIELACDERAVKNYDLKHKRAYSEALLEANVRGKYPIAFGGVGIKERVKNVLNYKKPTFFAAAASAVLCGAIAACFLTDPIASENNVETYLSGITLNTVTETLGKETKNTEELTAAVSSTKTAIPKNNLLSAEEIKDLDEEEKARLGYAADAEGNILGYVPEKVSDNNDIPPTKITPDDTDAILACMLDIKAVVREEGYKEFLTDSGLTVKTGYNGNTVILNLPAEKGSKALALKSGTVTEAAYISGLGYTAIVESDDGFRIYYSHLDRFSVKAGDSVIAGQVIGCAGETGIAGYPQIGYAIESVTNSTIP
ncbi:MAG: peptidoglycan DD-metalloendopeptidase family protein [Bacteroides sp.]|nr:peptidoglycan DD-metalloendopeptidase family protein [Bacteroides sp.]